MRITIPDVLYQQAPDMADPGIAKTEIFREAMKTFARVQAAKRLAALGSAALVIEDERRRRPKPAS
jgi:hypothetical protein